MNKGNVWVFAEQDGGHLEECSLELLGRGRVLADGLGVKLEALLLGERVAHLSSVLIAHGADTVYAADDGVLGEYQTLPYARVVTELVRSHHPQILLFGATPTGRDL
ncbi:MAG: electron transfer flavoprotein subunit alpha/FixB family protein, partial [Candidatus Eisenbacteria bacterium]|nr:electron transfer flavoprotein subunit alpha/FixB family protein [Candidatus Eisenbacteria bacterium]